MEGEKEQQMADDGFSFGFTIYDPDFHASPPYTADVVRVIKGSCISNRIATD